MPNSPMRFIVRQSAVAGLAFLLAIPMLGSGAPAFAQDGITVPDGTPQELVDFIKKTRRSRSRTLPQLREKYEAVLKASERILDAKSADDEAKLYAIQAKFSALGILRVRAENATARLKFAKQTRAFAEQLKDDKRQSVSTLAQSTLIGLEVGEVRTLTEPNLKALQARTVAFLKAGDLSSYEMDARQRFSAAMGLARTLETIGKNETAAAFYKQLAAALEAGKHEKWKTYREKMIGSARRMMLPGNPIVISGRTADGKPFDWKDYKGKVVLIDFWATWCGPCVAELPNVKKNYARYHAKGFEIVGVNMDTNREKMEKFLKVRKINWVNLFEPDKKNQGWDHPMATYYGVMGIPTVILVDQKGNVVSLRARGPELGKLLRKLLGPASDTEADSK